MNAAPIPTVMLKVSGMRISPSSAGKPSSMSLKSMSLTRLTIRKPTKTRTGPVATYGHEDRQRRQQDREQEQDARSRPR